MAVTPKIRRTYKGASPQATLDVSGVTGPAQTSIALSTAPTGWPTGKFFVVVAPGTAYEEKMCVTISGSTLTVVDPNNSSTSADADGRGVDDTTARSSIPGGSVVYPVFTARDADEANQLTSTYANQGGMVYLGDPSFTQLAIGTAGQVLKVNSGATAPEWGQIGTAAITDDAVTLDKLADAVMNKLVPTGTITAYGGASAPTGWLLCNGDAIPAQHTALIALVGANTPDLKGRFPLGKTASGTGSTLLGTGGSTTITEGNLPSHTHTMNHTHGTFTSTGQSRSHNHTVSLSDPGHGHGVTDPGHSHASSATGFLANNGYDWTPPGPLSKDWSYDVPTAAATTGISINGNTTGISVSSVGNASQDHEHNVTVTAFSGSTGGGSGSGTAYFQPFVSVNYIIKHD